jgi:GT2 family glycosyltransferase
MKLSVIILNFNGYKDTIECVHSHQKYSPHGTEIIVWDNGSTGDDVLLMQKEIGDVATIVDNRINLGVGTGFNHASKLANNEILVLQSSDTEVASGWAEPIIQQFEDNKNVAACQPKILQYFNKNFFDHVGGCGGYLGCWGFPFTRGTIFNTEEEDKGQYDTVAHLHWADSACLAIRHDLFDTMNGFDERFFAYMDEIDLCCRLRKQGYDIVSVPQGIIYHKGNHKWSKLSFRKRFHLHRNNLLMLLKNLPPMQCMYVLSIRLIISEPAACIYYLYKRQFECALAIPASIFSFFYHAPSFLKTRTPGVHNIRLAPFSIVVAYFFRRKHTFASLEYTIILDSTSVKHAERH